MASVNVAVKGAKELKNKYAKLSTKTMDGLVKGVNLATAIVEGSAKRICPVDTGYLRNSIHMKPAEISGNEVKGQVYTATEYAPYVEFGTGIRGKASNLNEKYPVSYNPHWYGQLAQPFLYPALENNKTTIEKTINRAVAKELYV